MKKNDQAKKIINKISQEEITPRPKWKFYAGNGFFWLLWAVLIFAGAVFGSLLFLNFFDFHPALLNFIGAGGYLMFILSNFPYFFLLFFLTFIVFGWMTIRKTKKGYRYNKFFVGAVILISVALLAGLIHAFNFDRKFEGRLAHKIPLQKNFVEKKYPGNYSVEKGFLAGEILLAGDKN